MQTDTIAAISTAPGEGAIALIRISGPQTRAIAAKICPLVPNWKPRRVQLAKIVDASGDAIDNGLATFFKGPQSYTGEDLLEISCHGGMWLTRKVLLASLAAGARSAEAGEFTQRAFLNGKMDLTQAEAVMDLVRARSDLAIRSAREQLDGTLGAGIESMRAALLSILAHVEAYIDFPDEDIDPQTGADLLHRMETLQSGIQNLLSTAEQGRILREGLRTVLCGAPNAGKSSLLNALSGHARAIVHESAGTTRDTIEEWVHVEGIPLRLIDTAGLRESEHPIEQEGIKRSRREMEHADLVLQVVDQSLPHPEQLEGPEERRILVVNKSDLPAHPDWTGTDALRVCCLSGVGIPELRRAILNFAARGNTAWGGSAVAVSARHRVCLERAAGAMETAIKAMRDGLSPEFIASDLHLAMRALGDILGHLDSEDLLGEIFSSFCIGK